MKKPQWLKTTYLKAKLSQVVAKLVSATARPEHYSAKVLISSIDGLGDAFLRLSIVNALAEKHGKQNVWVMTKPLAIPLYQALGIQTIAYTDRHRTNPIKRLTLVQHIHALRIATLYCLEFELNEDLIELLNIPTKIGFAHPFHPEYRHRLTSVIEHPSYVGIALSNFCHAARISPPLMDTSTFFPAENARRQPDAPFNVLIAIGAADRARMMRVSNLCQILQKIEQQYPHSRFTLIGTGKREEQYAAEIIAAYRGQRLYNRVSEFTLLQTIDAINQCDLLIGFDSGLYNLSFSLKKPTLCLAAANEKVLHHQPWVGLVRGTGTQWGQPDRYGCAATNSIATDDVIATLAELLRTSSTQALKP